MADFLVVGLIMYLTNYKDEVPHYFLLFNNTKLFIISMMK